jgi:curved DNA-binding protein CbpA
MPQFINYYELLKINSDASPEEIAKAYKKEFKEWQARQTSASDEEVRQEVSYMMENLPKARQVLLDPEQRKQHDRDIVDFDRRTLEPQDTQNTTNCDELIENGWKLLRIGQLKEALQIATQATNSFGNNPETWYLLAEAKFKNGQTEQSIYEYGRAIALNERDARYHFGLGLVYRSIARNIEALSELEKQFDMTQIH